MEKKGPLIVDVDDVITLREAAVIVRRSPATAWAWAIRGKLPAQDVAGRYLVRRSDAERLAAKQADPQSMRQNGRIRK